MSLKTSLLAALLLLLNLSWVAAQNATEVATQVAEAPTKIIAQTGVLGAFLILAGFTFLFFGHRLFKPTLFLAGFYFFGCLGYLFMINIEPAGGLNNRETVLLVASIVFGIVGGLLAICFWKLAVALLGALMGFALAMFVLSWKSGGVISSGLPRAGFICALSLVGSVIILFFQKPIIIVSTSIIGAYSMAVGVDLFAHTGFIETTGAFLTSSSKASFETFETNPKIYGMLGSTALLAIIGMVAQWRINRGRSFNGGGDGK